MSTPDTVNFVELLMPIVGASSATGIDLRADRDPGSLYEKVREARVSARDAERSADQGSGSGDGGLKAWRVIVDIAPVILTTQSKDLEIAAMLTEGLLRFHGIAGLRDGFRLIRELVDAFWDQLYPAPDDEGVITRLSPIINLCGEEGGADGTLVQPVRRIAITQAGDSGPFSLSHYVQAETLIRPDILSRMKDDARAARIAAQKTILERISAGAAQTPRAFFVELSSDLDQCIEEYEKLARALDRVAGKDAPSHKPVSDLLGELRHALGAIAPFLTQPAMPVAASAAETSAPQLIAAADQMSGREEAFAMLLRVADYFRRAEPQSTIPYVLEDLVRRARLSLTELLDELIPDETARRQFFISAGIKPSQRSSKTN